MKEIPARKVLNVCMEIGDVKPSKGVAIASSCASNFNAVTILIAFETKKIASSHQLGYELLLVSEDCHGKEESIGTTHCNGSNLVQTQIRAIAEGLPP